MTDHPLTVQRASGTLAQYVGHRRGSFPASAEECQRRLPRFPSTQQTSLTAAAAPRPRKSPNKLFQGFRGLGKAQTSCLKVSEGSERPKQVVSRFPRARKGPNRLFEGFRGLGSLYPANFAGLRRGSEGSEKGCMCVKERLSIILLINKGSKRKTHTRTAVCFVLYRSFNVMMAMAARIMPINQKRTTIFDSGTMLKGFWMMASMPALPGFWKW